MNPDTLPCGCVLDTHELGFKVSVSKCAFHRKSAGRGGLAYYEELRCIEHGIPQHRRLCRELEDALHEIGEHLAEKFGGVALEVGCGLGMYAPLLMKLGYQYRALEPDHEAAEWVRNTFMATVKECPFDDFTAIKQFDIILGAHVFEHVPHPVKSFRMAKGMLVDGGKLIMVIPDDTDLANPDHLSFFNEQNLKRTLEYCGFEKVRLCIKQIVPHEKFIYCVAS